MKQAKWIWYRGDFEIYHHLALSCRRQEKGCDYPCSWALSRPEASARFYKTFTAPSAGSVHIHTHSKGMVRFAGRLWPVNTDVPVPAGEHTITVELYDIEKFPALFADGDVLISDESWTADAYDGKPVPVGYKPGFFRAEDDPSVFPFAYRDLEPVASERIDGGVLYDYGRETFGPVTVDNPDRATFLLVYGESREEALDPENALLRETLTGADDPERPARAFRYLFVKGENAARVALRARYEYLPIEEKATFTCENALVDEIWSACAYTFRLNTREFFLDGIKRDRWVWSGDAYQSFMIARYLYNDPSVTERTITALLGKPPYKTHINTINDYSAYLILSVLDHYNAGGDREFLSAVYPTVRELYAFIVSRLDERGYVVRRPGDWIFIDWGALDKDGPHCCEQILLWKVYQAMAALSAVMGDADVYSDKAERLRAQILADYWDAEKGALIDSFTSGKRFVTRQTNTFAVLYRLVEGERKESVVRNALLNPDLPAITTPYFKLYELIALCEIGRLADAQDYIESYWGGMLREGATSVWETYNPAEQGAAHYAMYGSDFGKSLCHAWGSGPILLLSRYCAGVYPTAVGAKTFRVEPNPGKYAAFQARVPIRDGTVTVTYQKPQLTVLTDVDGGTLAVGGREIPLEAGAPCAVTLE